ncbi:MAG: hypothetical protein JSV19_06155 [Phycisphaerales bacterium]|nr:MAG: hypothetical protein JSV19_06155 [Phycisphaerales bacterium]
MVTGRPRGTIELICGCMFSGKSEELLRRLRARKGDRVRAFKHPRDDRYSGTEIVTHGRDRYDAIVVGQAAQIPDCLGGDEALVGIDEGHFFDAALPDVCRRLAEAGTDVIVTALDPDSWGKPFGVIERLKQVADKVVVMTATCAKCGRPATRNQRTTPIVDGNIVGGPEAFEPRCAECWHPPPEPHIR